MLWERHINCQNVNKVSGQANETLKVKIFKLLFVTLVARVAREAQVAKLGNFKVSNRLGGPARVKAEFFNSFQAVECSHIWCRV